MKKFALVIIVTALLACQPPPLYATPTPPLLTTQPIHPESDLEQAAGFASAADLRIAGVPAETYQSVRHEFVTADTTLVKSINQAGYTLLVHEGQVNNVLGEGNKRLCVMPYPKSTINLKGSQPGSPLPFIGHQYGQAVYGTSNPPAGLDAKDRPEVTVVEAVPLDGLRPDLRCALGRANANNRFFPPGTLQVLLINIINREIAGSLSAAHAPESKSTLRWNIPLAMPELVILDATGKYDRQVFNGNGCYYTPPTAVPPTAVPPTASITSRPPTSTPQVAAPGGKLTPPLTPEGKFDFKAEPARWPRIASQAELIQYVTDVKSSLSQPWAKTVCEYPFGPFEQPDRTQLIYYDYPACLCSQEPSFKKIAGFIIEPNGHNPMYGIITQLWSASGSRYFTALADLNGGTLSNPDKRALLVNSRSYLSVFGNYLKPPGGNNSNATLIETSILFMLANGWIKLDEYNAQFKSWIASGAPPPYFETHPAAGELKEFLIP